VPCIISVINKCIFQLTSCLLPITGSYTPIMESKFFALTHRKCHGADVAESLAVGAVASWILDVGLARKSQFINQSTNFVTYVRPILEYNTVIWSPCTARDIDAIERVQAPAEIHQNKCLHGYTGMVTYRTVIDCLACNHRADV